MNTKKKRQVTVAIILLAIGVLVPTYCVPALRSQTGYNVSPAECPFDVPSQATKVCFYRRAVFGPASYCECDCTAESFLAWAKSKGWEPNRVGERPHRIMRYARYAPREDANEKPAATWAEIVRGYFYERMSEADADGGIHVAYDLDTGRVYYYAHTR